LTRKLATVKVLDSTRGGRTHHTTLHLYTAVMSIKLPLHEMTLQEKLAAMDALWEDLSRSPDAIESPDWHNKILDGRRQQVADGTAQFEDWKKAKAKIREKLR
jgi:hypothetical protein